jgi:hypothetical protein
MSSPKQEKALLDQLHARLRSEQWRKLRAHCHRKWKDSDEVDLANLCEHLRDEVRELEDAGPTTVWLEAADVANLAAMIADVVSSHV